MRRPLLLLYAALAAVAASTAPESTATAVSSPSPPDSAEPSQLVDEASRSHEGEQEVKTDSQDVQADVSSSSSVVEEARPTATTATSAPVSRPSTAADETVEGETVQETTTSTAQFPPLSSSASSNDDLPFSSPPPPPPSPSRSLETPSPSPDAQPAASPEDPPPHVEQLPLTEIPPAPELLSFNEWRERYVVLPDPSLARRAKKAAQRTRQDAVGAAVAGAGAAEYDGDGADLGSLFVKSEEGGPAEAPARASDPAADAAALARRGDAARSGTEAPPSDETPSTQTSSPIQPLPHVGSGEPSDPLLHLKDRSNYAAFECAAMVHRSSRKSKGASSILVEKKDRYMLTPCSATPKFVDVELCDEIQIDTLVLANFEFFSSTFKHFKASCSVDYPGKPADWHDLGTFRARNVRGVQVFPVRNPHFCRYLRIDFLSHFGSEHYCPVSLLRVYGFTQLDAYREGERRKAKAIEDALAAAELIDDEQDEQDRLDDALRVEVENLERLEPGAGGTNATVEEQTTASSVAVPTGGSAAVPTPTDAEPVAATATPAPPGERVPAAEDSLTTPPSSLASSPSPAASSPSSEPVKPPSSAPSASSPPHEAADPSPSSSPLPSPSGGYPARSSSPIPHDSASVTTAAETREPNPSPSPPSSLNATSSSTVSSDSPSSAPSVSPPSSSQAPPASSSSPSQNPDIVPSASSQASSSDHSSRSAPPPPVHTPPATPSSRTPSAAEPSSSIVRHVPRNESHHYQHPPPARPPVIPPPLHQQPQPGESIYGTIMKRLTSLEHNQTLSMHFIEAQSSMLREAFGRVEKRLNDIEGSRTRQEQSIRQALIDLESRRVELERERLDLAMQVTLLAEDVRLERRLTIVQLIALFLLFVFVGFTRGIPTSPFIHLASSQLQRPPIPRKESKRKEEEQRSEAEKAPGPKAEEEDVSGGEAQRHRRALSTSYRQPSTSKRHTSLPKPGPRRHYGVGAPSSSKPLSAIRNPRPFTPPMRHSSAPPEEPFPSATALEAKEAARRRIFPQSARKAAPSAYEFPGRVSSGKLSKTSGLAIDTSPEGDLRGAGASSSSLQAVSRDRLMPFPSSHLAVGRSVLNPSTADEADTEPSDSPAPQMLLAGFAADDEGEEDGDDGRTGLASPLSSSSNGTSFGAFGRSNAHEDVDERDYHTYSSADEDDSRPFSTAVPPYARPRSPPVRSSSPRTTSSSAAARMNGRGGRPPRPQVRVRPATSQGIGSPVVAEDKGKGRAFDGGGAGDVSSRYTSPAASGMTGAALEPTATLPSPPPEPVELVEVKREEEDF
ncbi:hypothetical protein JCM6882_003877 [Rhodosporidiobolus microsporus]